MTLIEKVNRILFDVICIIAIVIFPLWILEKIGICNIVMKGGAE